TPLTTPPSLSFSSSSAHPHLHSFPTRRSSDLSWSRNARRASRHMRCRPELAEIYRTFMGVKRAFHFTIVNSTPSIEGVLLTMVKDRKSTRLNSSHVEISYAVFCLKKKKNKKIT